MTDETRRWFVEKLAQNPDYLDRVYLPELDKRVAKAETQLREANRKGTLEQIKYASGRLDGVEEVRSVIEGLRLSEGRPADPGLLDRIFSRTNGHRAESA